MSSTPPVVVIDASRRLFSPRAILAEYVEYSTLLRHLAKRDLLLRFRNPLLGSLWVILQPVLPVLIFAVVFSRVMQPAAGSIPYSLFALAGLAPWTFFSSTVSTAGMAFTWNANMINKVYFPRAVLPASAVLASLVELAVALTVVCLWSIALGFYPRWTWLWLPFLAATLGLFTFFASLALATLNAMDRNVKFAVPFVMQLWIYASPVVYPSSLISRPSLRWLLALNPMSGILEAFRAALFGTALDLTLCAISGISMLAFGVISAMLFRRFERTLAEMM